MTKKEQLQGMLLGAFVGDALALGAHWIYDRAEISQKLGVISGLNAPLSDYHPGKKAGDFTHLGDQMLLVQKSIAAHSGLFDADDYIASWRAYWQDPATISYRDRATRTVLAHMEDGFEVSGAGSTSAEMAGPVITVPVLVMGLNDGYDENALIAATKQLTRLTHRSAEALDTAAFMSRLFSGLEAGLDLDTSLDGSLGDSSQFIRDYGGKAESAAVQSLGTGAAVEKLGQSCDIAQALPSAILILRRYAHNFEQAMIENVMAGGDSAARGILIGAVLGYTLGVQAIPEAWRTGLNASIPGI